MHSIQGKGPFTARYLSGCSATHRETGSWHLCAADALLLMYLRPLRAWGCSQGPAL